MASHWITVIATVTLQLIHRCVPSVLVTGDFFTFFYALCSFVVYYITFIHVLLLFMTIILYGSDSYKAENIKLKYSI